MHVGNTFIFVKLDPWPYCIFLKVDIGLYPEAGVVVQLVDPWTVLYLIEG